MTQERQQRERVHFNSVIDGIVTYREKLEHLRPSQRHLYATFLARLDELEPQVRSRTFGEWSENWMRPKEGTVEWFWRKLTSEITQAAFQYIEMSDCERGAVYRLHSRNLVVGVYDGEQGFIGIRNKFDRDYLFTEYHYDQGPPHGTVHPLEKIEMLSEDIPAKETLGDVCRKTQRPVFYRTKEGWTDYKDGPRGDWVYVDTGEKIPEHPESCCVSISNTALFEFLRPLSDAEYARLQEERWNDLTTCAQCQKHVPVKDVRYVNNKRICAACRETTEAP